MKEAVGKGSEKSACACVAFYGKRGCLFIRANEATNTVHERNIHSRNMVSEYDMDKTWMNKGINM